MEDAVKAVDLGVNALGFNFWPHSKRYITPDHAKEIIKDLPIFVQPVGIFVNQKPDEIKKIVKKCKLNIIQLHGLEQVEFVNELPKVSIIKAFRTTREKMGDLEQWKKSKVTFLVDGDTSLRSIRGDRINKPDGSVVIPFHNTFGGEGVEADEEMIISIARFGKYILAGGLTAQSVGEKIKKYRPFAVDVASGIESAPGIKDHAKMCAFVAAVQGADSSPRS